MASQVISVVSKQNREVVDITDQVQAVAKADGLVNVFVTHTTAAVTTVSLDPGLDIDLIEAVWQTIPQAQYRHGAEHAPSHLISSIIGPSLSVPVEGGKLQLGSWQRIVLVELDGPKQRRVVVSQI